MRPPHERLAEWMRAREWTQSDAASALGCSQTFVSKLLTAKRAPGRRIALEIERLSADWGQGPLRASEWESVSADDEPEPATGTDG